jgi:folate-binding protein YgfZ
MIPTASAALYDAARRRAALLDRTARGRIVVSGADRASYLQGLLTNDITALTAGRGCYAAYLTAQGRMIADLWIYEIGDVMLLAMDGDVKATVLARLDQFIFSEDVQLGDVTDTFAQVAVLGPQAATVVSGVVPALVVEMLTAMRDHDVVRVAADDRPMIATRSVDLGEPGFELYGEHPQMCSIVEALRASGIAELDEATAEALRIEAGTPRFHRDMDETTIPLEAGIESRAISFTKGCYVGQEVIIRVLHRGHGRVAKRLVGLRIDGAEAPAAGTMVRIADREIGHVTSATVSPALQHPIALAYVHRDFVEPGTNVTVGETAAQVAALPFVPLQA